MQCFLMFFDSGPENITNFSKMVEKNKKNIYNEVINQKTVKREGSDFYENKNNREGTKDNRSNQ